MNCISCQRESGYNRAVVDLSSGIEVGGYCRSCELAEFGRSLERGYWRASEGCSFCERDGHFAIPLWEPKTTRRGADVVSYVEYSVTERTIVLCDEHLHGLSERDEHTDAALVANERK